MIYNLYKKYNPEILYIFTRNKTMIFIHFKKFPKIFQESIFILENENIYL